MSRMWGVHPMLLCDQHLLGEHNEMHQVAGSIENHSHGEAIAEGHAKKSQIDTSLIQKRHDRLAQALEQRGMNHDSPLDYDDELDIGEIDVYANKQNLANRCEDCKERIDKYD